MCHLEKLTNTYGFTNGTVNEDWFDSELPYLNYINKYYKEEHNCQETLEIPIALNVFKIPFVYSRMCHI